MRKTLTAVVLAIAVLTAFGPPPASAITPAFFENYQSVGAMIINTGTGVPGAFSRGALILLMFNPAEFTPAEAQSTYLSLASRLTGGQNASISPSDVANFGASALQAIAGMQNFFLDSETFSEFYIFDVHKAQPAGARLDLYLFFSFNDYRYAVTLQF